MKHYDLIIVGGGAAGFFAAVNAAEFNPDLKIAILERGKEVLTKVRVSGGGRCNVTHAEFVPQELVKYYPRGEKELLGPFHQFMTGDTIEWFEKRGVTLKIEDDGRMFPLSDSSQTIIDCFLHEAKKHKVQVLKSHAAKAIFKDDEFWCVKTNQGDFSAPKFLITTGSNTKVWNMLKQLGHSIVTPVPSLFTFNINDNRIKGIPGVVVQHVEVKVIGTNLVSEGPLLITHVGMSAPSILKLSAYGARELAEKNYNFSVKINFVLKSFDECINCLIDAKAKHSRKAIYNTPLFALPRRLWQSLVIASQIPKEISWADSKKEMLVAFAKHLTEAVFKVEGKSTFKEEFVTAGGIDLKEINFKTFESKVHKNLYFAGEVLNIDAVTGGFNFQNAWTGAFIASKSIAKKS